MFTKLGVGVSQAKGITNFGVLHDHELILYLVQSYSYHYVTATHAGGEFCVKSSIRRHFLQRLVPYASLTP